MRLAFLMSASAVLPMVLSGQEVKPGAEIPLQPPPYKMLRFDEDYFHLTNQANRTDWFDPVKYMRRGEIDLALTNHGADLLSRDFYTHKLASVPSLARIRAQSCYSAIVFIDHQPQMLFGVASMDRASLIYQRHTCIHQGMTMSTRSKKLASPHCRRHFPRRRHRDPQAGQPGREGPRGSQVLAQIRHNFYTRFLLARVLRFGVSPNYKGKQESASGFCLQQ